MALALIYGAAMLAMRKYLKKIDVPKAGPLNLLLKEISSLYTEAIFSNHSAYYFVNIFNTFRL